MSTCRDERTILRVRGSSRAAWRCQNLRFVTGSEKCVLKVPDTDSASNIPGPEKKTKEKASLLIQDLGNEFQLRSSAAHGHSSRSAGLRQISHAQNSGLSNRSPLSHDLVRHAACQSVGGAAIPLRVNKDHLYILTIKVLVPRRPKSTKTIRSSIHKHNTTTQSIKKCTGSY